jgi:serine/threonine protein kinase
MSDRDVGAVAANTPEHRRVGLVIGVGDYLRADWIRQLPYARQDARAVAHLLLDPAVCGFSRERVAVLTDKRAGRARVMRKLSQWLPSHARGAELAVLYFAGHGMVQRVGRREEGFLLPHDADPDDLATSGVAMSDLANLIDRIEAEAVVVILDCCHAGKALPREGVSTRSVPHNFGIGRPILEGLAGTGRVLIASCGDGEKSVEVPDLHHGLFTYHLLQGLKGAADNDRDGRVGLAELFNYVSAAVKREAAEKYQHTQRPWFSFQHNDDIYISYPQKSPEPPPEPEPQPAVPVIDYKVSDADEQKLIDALRQLRRRKDPAGVPLLMRCLAHRTEAVRDQAKKAGQALGWEKMAAAVEELARAGNAEQMGHVLEGLAAIEANADVIALLDRLGRVLTGDLLYRVALLLERKHLSLELEKVRELFRAKGSPYELQRVLGAGLFAAAYLAQMRTADLPVVVRVLRPEFAGKLLVRAQFQDLGRRSVRLNHHNLIPTRDVGEFGDKGIYYTVRNYIEGTTLREVLESRRRLEPPKVLRLLRQVAEALTPLHEDESFHGGDLACAFHGGVKPSNIFLAKKGRVILGDPSLPVPAAGADLKRLAYDFRYVAPEMVGGPCGPQVDFYSLGCVAYELFCGVPPFAADNHFDLYAMHKRDAVVPATARGSALGVAGDRFLARLLAKNPAQRFASLEELLRELDFLDALLRPHAERPPSGGDEGEGTGRTGYRPQPPDLPGPPSVAVVDEASLVKYQDMHSLIALDLSKRNPLETMVPVAAAPERASDTGAWEAPSHAASVDADPSGIAPPAGTDPAQTLAPASDGPPGAGFPGERVPQVPGYEMLEVIGRGGMGVVFKARQISLERLVALKMIVSGAYARSQQLVRFRQEARAVARLQHPHIVQVFEIGEAEGLPYICLEFLSGGSLNQRLMRAPQTPRGAAELVEKLARAIHHAHQHGIIHRDVKPANVLFAADETPKLTDFGLAKLLGGVSIEETQSGEVLGTPTYMAPEQASGGARDVGPAVDIYGLGAILYELLTGQPPFRGNSPIDTLLKVREQEPVWPRAIRREVPRDLEIICLKCLEKIPERRYASAETLADDLRRFLASKPILARRPFLLERLWNWIKRREGRTE